MSPSTPFPPGAQLLVPRLCHPATLWQCCLCCHKSKATKVCMVLHLCVDCCDWLRSPAVPSSGASTFFGVLSFMSPSSQLDHSGKSPAWPASDDFETARHWMMSSSCATRCASISSKYLATLLLSNRGWYWSPVTHCPH